MEGINATQLITENYLTYGQYIDSFRAVPGIDGLKAVQRRVLLAVKDEASGKFQRSSQVVGRCLGYYHPHGDCYETLVRMVRDGYVIGHGNFGGLLPQDEAAAMRYTSVKASTKFNESIFKLVPHAPSIENEFGNMEPTYLPVPIPLCLTTGSRGIGVGLLSMIPSFSATSLYKALVNDDPKYLQAPKGLNIVSGEIEKIWTRGEGFLTYGLHVYKKKSLTDDKQVSIIEGSPRVFFPEIDKIFGKELDEETVYIRDESVDNIRLIVSRVKAIKRINDDQVHEMAQQAAAKTLFCRIYVSDGKSAIRMGLQEWLQLCWEKYSTTVEAYKSDQISKLEHKKRVCELIPVVYPLLLKGMKTKAIAGQLKETMVIIRDIESRPLRMLRKTDFDADITQINSEIRQIQKLTSKELGEGFVTSLADLQTGE